MSSLSVDTIYNNLFCIHVLKIAAPYPWFELRFLTKYFPFLTVFLLHVLRR